VYDSKAWLQYGKASVLFAAYYAFHKALLCQTSPWNENYETLYNDN